MRTFVSSLTRLIFFFDHTSSGWIVNLLFLESVEMCELLSLKYYSNRTHSLVHILEFSNHKQNNNLKTKHNFIARVKPTKFPYENEIFGVGEITTVKKTDFGPAHILRTNTKPPLAGPYGMCVFQFRHFV